MFCNYIYILHTIIASVTLIRYAIGQTQSHEWGSTSAPSKVWRSVASSSNGANIVATVYDGTIYRSPDFGTNWYEVYSRSSFWTSVATDAKGQFIIAASISDGVYYSKNNGLMWNRSNTRDIAWSNIASDATGQYIISSAILGPLFVSNSGGIDFFPTIGSPTAAFWTSVAVSCNGDKMIATATLSPGYPDGIYISIDYGVHWQYVNNTSGILWQGIAISQDIDGLIVVAVSTGGIYLSTDGGFYWTLQDSAPTNTWSSVSMSRNGQHMIASTGTATKSGMIYVSSDYGGTWVKDKNSPIVKYSCVKMDYTGLWIVASVGDVRGGNIFLNKVTNHPTPLPTIRTTMPGVGAVNPSLSPLVITGVILIIFSLCMASIAFGNCYYERKIESSSDLELRTINTKFQSSFMSKQLTDVGTQELLRKSLMRSRDQYINSNSNSNSNTTTISPIRESSEENRQMRMSGGTVGRDYNSYDKNVSLDTNITPLSYKSRIKNDKTQDAPLDLTHNPYRISRRIDQSNIDTNNNFNNNNYGIDSDAFNIKSSGQGSVKSSRDHRSGSNAFRTPLQTIGKTDEDTEDAVNELREYETSNKIHLQKSLKGKALRESTSLLVDLEDDDDETGSEYMI